MGTSDLLKPAIEHELKGTIHFGRVNVKPGKPTTFAMIPTPGGRNELTPIFALPGNPASALVTFHIFVVPALRKLGGLSGEACHLPRLRVKVRFRYLHEISGPQTSGSYKTGCVWTLAQSTTVSPL